MGASASKATQTINSELENILSNKCTDASATNLKKNFKVSLKNSDCGVLDFSQAATIKGDCVIDNSVETFAKLAAENKAQAQAGLGIAATDSEQDIKTKIKNKIENDCGTVAATNEIIDFEFNGDNISCDVLNVSQKADATAACVINTVSKVVSDIQASNTSESKGYDPLAALGGLWGIMIIGGIVLVVLFGGGIMKSAGKTPQGKTIKMVGGAIIGLAIMGLIGFLIYQFGIKPKQDAEKEEYRSYQLGGYHETAPYYIAHPETLVAQNYGPKPEGFEQFMPTEGQIVAQNYGPPVGSRMHRNKEFRRMNPDMYTTE